MNAKHGGCGCAVAIAALVSRDRPDVQKAYPTVQGSATAGWT